MTVDYASAMRAIGEMEQSGRSTANKLGDAVLQGNRTRLSDIANSARTAANSYELGHAFDVGTYGKQFDDTLGSLNSSLSGDIYGALEGQKFFDVGTSSHVVDRHGCSEPHERAT